MNARMTQIIHVLKVGMETTRNCIQMQICVWEKGNVRGTALIKKPLVATEWARW